MIKSAKKPWEGKKWDIYRPGVDEPYVTEDFDEMMRFKQDGFKVKLHKEESVKSSRKTAAPKYDARLEEHKIYHNDVWKLELYKLKGNTAMLRPIRTDDWFVVKNPRIDEDGDLIWDSDTLPVHDYDSTLEEFQYYSEIDDRLPIDKSKKFSGQFTDEDIENLSNSHKPIKSERDKTFWNMSNGYLTGDEVIKIINEIDGWCAHRALTHSDIRGYSDNDVTPGEASDSIREIITCLEDLSYRLNEYNMADDEDIQNGDFDDLLPMIDDAENLCKKLLTEETYSRMYNDIFKDLELVGNRDFKLTSSRKIASSKKVIKSKLNFDKITDMCDDLDFSTLGYGRDPQGDMIAKLDAIEGESGNIEGIEIRFTENDDGQTVIAVYKKDHKVDTMTTKLVDGEISRDDINEAVYDFLEENSQMLNSSRKSIKSAKSEDKETVSVDVNSLYHFLTDSETAEVESDFAIVRCDEDDGETYYDILSDGDLACMDGETCEIVGRGEGFVELHSIEANDGVNFKLSSEEFEVACGKSKKQIKSSILADKYTHLDSDTGNDEKDNLYKKVEFTPKEMKAIREEAKRINYKPGMENSLIIALKKRNDGTSGSLYFKNREIWNKSGMAKDTDYGYDLIKKKIKSMNGNFDVDDDNDDVFQSRKAIKSSLTSDSFERMIDESRKMAKDMDSKLEDWWVTSQVGQDVVYFVAEHNDYSVRVRFEFVDSGFCYVSKTYTNGSYYEPVALESWKYEGLSSQEIEGKMTAVLNDFFPKYNEIGSSKKPVESSVDYEPLTKLLDDLGAYPESRMPPAGIYKRLLDWKVSSEGMDEKEAREKFGTFTVGEWIDDLKESVM